MTTTKSKRHQSTIARNAVARLLASILAFGTTSALAHGEKKHRSETPVTTYEQKEFGIGGNPRKISRTIEVTMLDTMQFVPDRLDVDQGETVKITLKNEGKLLHEFVIGSKAELDAHAALMLKFPDMEHDEPYMAHVPAGGTGSIVWRFNRTGSFDFACLIAGHYQAGMVGKIMVKPAKRATPKESR